MSLSSKSLGFVKSRVRWYLILSASAILLYSRGWVAAAAPVSAEQSERTTHMHEAGGRIVEQLHEVDLDKDGKVDGVQSTVFEYDRRGRLAKKTLKPAGRDYPAEVTVFEYEEDGSLLIGETMHRDVNGDDAPDYKTVTKLENEDGRLARKVVEEYPYGSSLRTWRHTTEFSYADDGRLTRELLNSQNLISRAPAICQISSFEYDGETLSKKVVETKAAVTGKVTSRTTIRFDRDDSGAVVMETKEYDRNGDGQPDDRNIISFQSTNEIAADYTRLWQLLPNVALVAILLILVLRHRRARALSA